MLNYKAWTVFGSVALLTHTWLISVKKLEKINIVKYPPPVSIGVERAFHGSIINVTKIGDIEMEPPLIIKSQELLEEEIKQPSLNQPIVSEQEAKIQTQVEQEKNDTEDAKNIVTNLKNAKPRQNSPVIKALKKSKQIKKEAASMAIPCQNLKATEHLFENKLKEGNSIQRTKNCNNYLQSYYDVIFPNGGYSTEKKFPEYQDEKNEPTKLAFTYVAHNQPGLFEVLLHLTFRPYNAYCIYVGKNTNSKTAEALRKIVECYQMLYPQTKIFMAKNTSAVVWGEFSLIQADLTCMDQLLQLTDHPWEYLINLAGTELPTYSVDELSSRLTSMKKAANIFTDSYAWLEFKARYSFVHNRVCKGTKCAIQRTKQKITPPYGLKVFKGYKNTIVRRDLANFTINHPVGKAYREFLSHTGVPDEHLYATLSRINKVEEILDNTNTTTKVKNYKVSQFDLEKNYHVKDGFCQRISLWDHSNFYSPVRYHHCFGKISRQICHLGLDDLKEVFKRNMWKDGRQNCFVANKFDVTVDPLAIICMARTVYQEERDRTAIPKFPEDSSTLGRLDTALASRRHVRKRKKKAPLQKPSKK